MLTPLVPRGDRSRTPAYPLPWRVERLHESHSLVTNIGVTTLDMVRVFVHLGSARTETHHWGIMAPRDSAELCLCALDAGECVITVAWVRPRDGREYVWRFEP